MLFKGYKMKKIFKTALWAGLISCTFMILSCNPKSSSPREVISLGGEWQFAADSQNLGESDQWFSGGIPSSLVTGVTVPHTWNTMPGLEKYWGKGWYERTVDIPTGWQNKTIRLQFDAVFHDALVWVNGIKVAEHRGSGYNRFFADITKAIKPGEKNQIVVCADNSPSPNNIPFMKSYDWSNDGGITRNVYLIATHTLAIGNLQVNGIPDLGKPGTGRAVICITLLNPDSNRYRRAIFKAVIRKENQKNSKTIWKGTLKGIMDKGEFTYSLSLKHIKWWNFDEPNLYNITVTLINNGKEEDVYTSTFGFRTIGFSGDRFLLNGEPVRLAGVEWMPGSSLSHGSAETKDELEKNLQLMKNVNAIYTRFHWQQDEAVFDWCDRHGILVQEEIPYWGGATMLNDTLEALGRQHLEEMTSSQFNHPSIIAWGIGNELNSHDSVNIHYLKELYQYARLLDSSRLVNYVSNQLQAPLSGDGKVPPDASATGDVLMFNEYYSTWYGQNLDSVSPALDRIHREYPGKGLVISEFGLCEPVHKGGDPRRIVEMKRQFSIYSAKPYIAGAIYFCLNDYRTHMGEDFTYSYPQRVHGVADIHLKPKPSYEVLKKILCPLEIVSVQKNNGDVKLVVRGKTGIPSYTIRGYIFQTARKSVILDELQPGQEKPVELRYDTKADTLKIWRPTGFLVNSLPL